MTGRRTGTSPIRISPGQSLADALLARTPKDYAIEFGEYLAKSAERYMDAVNKEYFAQTGWGGRKCDAEAECHEAYRDLKSAIYEFRKRKDRV